MIEQWFGTDLNELWFVVVSAATILIWTIIVIRVIGLRALSKMSSFDFVVTVAIGSIVAGVVSTPTSVWHGGLAVASLLGGQWLVAQLRRRWRFEEIVDNEPLLLMEGRLLLEANLASARVTEADITAKLREANVTSLDQVLAVVLETTGDVSVLHGDGPLEPHLLDGVRR